MAGRQIRSWQANEKPAFDRARDELFGQITQCRVRDADAEHQAPWFDDAMEYFRERYPSLDKAQLQALREVGERFAEPSKVSTGTAG
jgi:hypothetical protein